MERICNDIPRMVVLLIACLLGGCAAPAGKCALSLAADLAVAIHERSFYTVLAFGRESARLIIDTGADNDILRNSDARRLGLGQRLLGGVTEEGIGGSRRVNLAAYRSQSHGGASAGTVQFLTMDDAALPDWSSGLLGMQLMGQFDDDLDFGAGHLRLIRATGDCYTPATGLTEPVFSTPLLGTSEPGAAIVVVKINGHRLSALIDSGASTSFIGSEAAGWLGLTHISMAGQTTTYISGIGKRRPKAVFGRLEVPLSIGDLDIAHLPVGIVDEPIGGGIDMVLGYDFLLAVHVWISHSSQTLVMQYPPQPTTLVTTTP